ncbi:hypothetical protein AZ78_5006 [Lysobacter capsici AZ78]|uniref:Methyl-accepting chemotaxis protein n=1 Tax=Lysobacter capsici AZ78 TaxID=1444315 RepID=A0A108U4D9_9GAMM|nr:hypothetical protein [Lysobacter capsici]KWS02339.1 hypothetical protein AZ78_5006 [Lysobacter capsici AZ78]
MNDTATTAPRINAGVKDLHKALIAQQQALVDRLNRVRSSDEADALVREMHEINFRVMTCGSLLFKQTSAQIDTQVESVIAATGDLESAIASATRIAAVIKAASKFLGLVDKVLDKIKLA